MGWFWAESPKTSKFSHAPHPIPTTDAAPPPECPMYTAPLPSRGITRSPQSSNRPPAAMPVPPTSQPLPPPPSTLSRLNPLNYMPASLSNKRDYSTQTTVLPISRTTSSIPRGDGSATNWEYPSPQQMYNAMLRKGYTDTPEDAVESMVEVHNFLNEGAWEEIVAWEDIFRGGLERGWKQCRLGEAGMQQKRAREEERRQWRREQGLREPVGLKGSDGDRAEGRTELLRFQGRPKDMTPKAATLQALGWIWPTKYGCEPPFDRHDWYIKRHTPSGTTQEIRYVIDYYSGEPEVTGEPVFYLDIRPAIDTPTAAVERMMRWGGDVWVRASGRPVDEKES